MRFAGTGDVYVGDYSDDELTGDGTMHYGLTGDVYTGMWLRGRVKHTHTHTHTNGVEYVCYTYSWTVVSWTRETDEWAHMGCIRGRVERGTQRRKWLAAVGQRRCV